METAARFTDLVISFFKKSSMTFKMIGILILVLVLLIPLTMIKSVLKERMGRRNEAVAGISSTWGNEQTIVGPVLVIPYQYKTKVWKEQQAGDHTVKVEVEELTVGNAYILPASLDIKSDIQPSELHRGIYKAVVYKGSLDISGRFPSPDLAELGIAESDLQWEKAVVTLAVSDLRGIGKILSVKIGDQTTTFTPGCRLSGYPSGITARLPKGVQPGAALDFKTTLDLKGSQGISFAPVGQENRVKMASPWAAPSFRGGFLPTERQFGAKGFDVAWEISMYGRGYPQQSAEKGGGCALNADAIARSLFGVDFIVPVDNYRIVERATKYGILFIALIFTAFFLFEVLSALRIHTLQYTLVGAALCLFYLAVLSLSEFILLVFAYWIGAAASMLLIVLYSHKVLRGGKRTSIIAAALLVIYTYLYVVLQMQDYSLILGTAGLFVVLGILMYATRNIDWAARK
jgi:inner membrane protein